MKKSVLKTIALLTSFAITACSQDIVVENTQNRNDGDAINKICITGKDFQIDDDTRSSVTIGESGASFAWDEDDVIGIFPDKGDQVSFAMEQGAGTQTATFTGGGWALKSSAKYAAYYPHVYENRDLSKIPVSYVGQTQNGNGNTEHIGAYDFMAANVTTPSNGAVAFDMQHLGALVQLTITVPEPSALTKIELSSLSNFTQTGTINLTAERPVITADAQSNTFEIALNNVATTKANENVIVYFMTVPIDLSQSELTATIYFSDQTTREAKIIGKNFEAGKAYRLAIDIENPTYYIDEYGINHGEGIEIDGIVWAPVNCGYHVTDYKYGKLYQWGRKYGQGYAGIFYNIEGEIAGEFSDATVPTIEEGGVSVVTGNHKSKANVFFTGNDWIYSKNDMLWNSGSVSNPIKSEYDPCPDGWRVPTYTELDELIKNYSSWTTNEIGQLGRWFSGHVAYSSEASQVFLPAAGRLLPKDGNADYRNYDGRYWSSSPYSSAARRVKFSSNYVRMDNNTARATGSSVRCVRE